jgi:hypothetical protein
MFDNNTMINGLYFSKNGYRSSKNNVLYSTMDFYKHLYNNINFYEIKMDNIEYIKPNINCVIYSEDKEILYQGCLLNNECNGIVEIVNHDTNQIVYKGNIENGKYNGKGEIFHNDFIYTGTLKQDVPNGKGILVTKKPKDRFQLELTYNGEWLNGKRHGYAIVSDLIRKYKGYYDTDLMHNWFIFYIYDNKCFECCVKHGECISGKLYKPGGDLLYQGELSNGVPNGYGILYYWDSTNRQYLGMFKDGKYHGEGELFYRNNRLYFSGMFDNNTMINGLYFSKNGYRSSKNKHYIDEYDKHNDVLVIKQNGENIYKGYFKNYYLNCNANGDVKMFINGVIHYTGNVQNNLYHGKGILHMIDINLVIDGEFYKNKLVSIYSIMFNKQKITINITDKCDIFKAFLLKLSDKNETDETNETNKTDKCDILTAFTDFLLKLSDKNKTDETNETNKTDETNETNKTDETNETNDENIYKEYFKNNMNCNVNGDVKTIINGVIHYTGNVQNNLYHGKGILHMIDVKLVIDGEF